MVFTFLKIWCPHVFFTSQCGLHNRNDFELRKLAENHDPEHQHLQISPVYKRRWKRFVLKNYSESNLFWDLSWRILVSRIYFLLLIKITSAAANATFAWHQSAMNDSIWSKPYSQKNKPSKDSNSAFVIISCANTTFGKQN